jgi:hypothetical protein
MIIKPNPIHNHFSLDWPAYAAWKNMVFKMIITRMIVIIISTILVMLSYIHTTHVT